MRIGAASSVLLVFVLQLGCSGPARLPADRVKEQLGQIYKAYQLADKELRHPPKNEAEFKPFLAKVNTSEAALQSVGDGKPFVIIWGAITGTKAMALAKPLGEGGDSFPPILAYEQTGTPGKRHVLFATGQMTFFDEKQFSGATFMNNHKPQTSAAGNAP